MGTHEAPLRPQVRGLDIQIQTQKRLSADEVLVPDVLTACRVFGNFE